MLRWICPTHAPEHAFPTERRHSKRPIGARYRVLDRGENVTGVNTFECHPVCRVQLLYEMPSSYEHLFLSRYDDLYKLLFPIEILASCNIFGMHNSS